MRQRHRITVQEYLRKQWLLVGILTCIFLAALYPELGSKEGPLHTDLTVKFGAVSLIFLISGLQLKTDSLADTFRNYKLHLVIQSFTFVVVPIVTQILTRLLGSFGVNPWVLKGLVTVACMPPPVSSAVILTRAAGGNETGAIFNSVLGSFLGILFTPFLLLFNLGFTTIIPAETIFHLGLTVLLPLLVGQKIRQYTNFRGHTLPLNTIGQAALLFVIYTTFCDTFTSTETGLGASDVLITVLTVVLMQMFFTLLSYWLGLFYKNHFTVQDRIALMFCSTHKSLTLGIPILRLMFHGYAHLSQISLPLLVYHPTQIILGGLICSQLKDWVHSNRKRIPV